MQPPSEEQRCAFGMAVREVSTVVQHDCQWVARAVGVHNSQEYVGRIRVLKNSKAARTAKSGCATMGREAGGVLRLRFRGGGNAQPPDGAGVIGEADVACGFFQDAF